MSLSTPPHSLQILPQRLSLQKFQADADSFTLLYDEMDELRPVEDYSSTAANTVYPAGGPEGWLGVYSTRQSRKSMSKGFVVVDSTTCIQRLRWHSPSPTHPCPPFASQSWSSSHLLDTSYLDVRRDSPTRIRRFPHRQPFERRVSAQCTGYAVPSSVVDGGVDRGKAKLPSAPLAAHTIDQSVDGAWSKAFYAMCDVRVSFTPPTLVFGGTQGVGTPCARSSFRLRGIRPSMMISSSSTWMGETWGLEGWFSWGGGMGCLRGCRECGFDRTLHLIIEASSASAHQATRTAARLYAPALQRTSRGALVDSAVLSALRLVADGYAGGRARIEVTFPATPPFNFHDHDHSRPTFAASYRLDRLRVHARHDPQAEHRVLDFILGTATRPPVLAHSTPGRNKHLLAPFMAHSTSTASTRLNEHPRDAHVYIFTRVRSPLGEISLEKSAHCAVSFAVVPWPLRDHSFSSIALESES
ncbi:hypothetical protein R3P38DRAFT_3193730 [Favolaschia claudopus]|uniref:Uncharacterized protein n=1 Tax=Favolaschia claudopus TaxID=2862362 RepID=A0AAW0BFA8_9AGAR